MLPLKRRFPDTQIVILTNFVVVSSAGIKRIVCIKTTPPTRPPLDSPKRILLLDFYCIWSWRPSIATVLAAFVPLTHMQTDETWLQKWLFACWDGRTTDRKSDHYSPNSSAPLSYNNHTSVPSISLWKTFFAWHFYFKWKCFVLIAISYQKPFLFLFLLLYFVLKYLP